MRCFLILVFSLYSMKSVSQNPYKHNDSITISIKATTIEDIRDVISKYSKGDFYDLVFAKPQTRNEAKVLNLTNVPTIVMYNPEGQKLCRRNQNKYLPSKVDSDFIKENFKPCFKQYREDKNGEKIPELIPYELDQLMTKTEALNNKKELNPNTYTVVYPWKIQFIFPTNFKVKTYLKGYFKKLYKSTKKQNYNLIRLNRDLQKSWGFGDSIVINAKVIN